MNPVSTPIARLPAFLLTQVVNPSSETTSFSYDAANRQTGQTSGNGSTVTTTFDNANRPTEVLHKDSSKS